ncbi:MAG TPA: DNA polymerase III subunit gamma/tau [Candidatus Limnocylindrales bacterium]|nr:DNA polymerase III subunit gamma/tau [Candidatus Limnocylindrales bacterium]
MSYEVVARRWRPLSFSSVVGQSHVTTTLANAIKRDRVPHAFLFTGTRGVGKTTVARLLARALNCSNRQGAEPCNQCPSCSQSLAGASVDVIEIDGASNRGIDEVRHLIEASQYRPAIGRYKVYIIDEVHQLSTAAFNALLKTLEEPPPHVKFIMATTEVHKLPATVLSRCQRYDFRRLGEEEITEQLARIAGSDSLPIARPALALLAREADGSMRDAQSLLEQVLSGADGELSADDVAQVLGVAGTELVSGCVEAVLRGEPARIVELVAQVRRYGYDAEKLVGEILETVRHVTVAAVAGAGALGDNVPEAQRRLANELSGARSVLDLQRIFSSLLGTASDLRRGSHPELVLEMGLLKVASLEPVATAAEILARLNAGGDDRGGRGAQPAAGAGVTPVRAPAAPPQRVAAPAPAAPQRTAAPPPAAAPARQAPAPAAAAPRRQVPGAADTAGSLPPAATAGVSDLCAAAPPGPAGERLPLAGSRPPAQPEVWDGAEGEPPEPVSDEEAAARRWEAFVNDARTRYGLDLYVTLTNCKATRITPTHLDLWPTSTAVRPDKLQNPTVMSRITELARVHFGPDVKVSITDSGGGGDVSMQRIENDRIARKRQEALADPLVGRAVSELGGRVTKVSVLDE